MINAANFTKCSNCKSSCSQRQEDGASSRAAAFEYDYAYYFSLKVGRRGSEAGRCIQGHVRVRARPPARTASPMSRVAVQFSRKADYEKRRSYFSIFVSLLRVMHAGQPSNLRTLLQSQTTSGLRARSFTVCARTVKVHLSAQGSVQYTCAWPSAL